jgi:hypothetical protein
VKAQHEAPEVDEELEALVAEFDALFPDAVNADEELRRSMGHSLDLSELERQADITRWLEEIGGES